MAVEFDKWDGMWTGLGPLAQQIKGKETQERVKSIRGLESAGQNELLGIRGDFDHDGVESEGLIQDLVRRSNDVTRLFSPPTEGGVSMPEAQGSSEASTGILAPTNQGVVV